jgi:hypothetical protein
LYMHKVDRSAKARRLFRDVASMAAVLHLSQACCASWRLMHTEPNPFLLATIRPRRPRRVRAPDGENGMDRKGGAENGKFQSSSSGGGGGGGSSSVSSPSTGRARRHKRPSAKWKWPDNSLDGRRLKVHPLYVSQVHGIRLLVAIHPVCIYRGGPSSVYIVCIYIV